MLHCVVSIYLSPTPWSYSLLFHLLSMVNCSLDRCSVISILHAKPVVLKLVLGPAASVPPNDLIDMHVTELQPRATDSEPWGWGQAAYRVSSLQMFLMKATVWEPFPQLFLLFETILLLSLNLLWKRSHASDSVTLSSGQSRPLSQVEYSCYAAVAQHTFLIRVVVLLYANHCLLKAFSGKDGFFAVYVQCWSHT